MTDLLVPLYRLPPVPESEIPIRRALAPERHRVLDWVRAEFSAAWASECAVAFGTHPLRCFLAVDGEKIAGFACYNATFRGFFGPVGVHPDWRGRGIGTALLLRALHAMRDEGFAYAVIGATKAEAYYERTVGAIRIPDSWPGAYEGMVK